MIKVFILGPSLKNAEEFMAPITKNRDSWVYVSKKSQVKAKIHKDTPFYVIYGFVKPNVTNAINFLRERNQEFNTPEIISFMID